MAETKMRAANPEFERLIRESFARQTIMGTLGAALGRVEAGLVEIELPSRRELFQQHNFIHAGVLATIADSASGYAALSVMPAGSAALAVEFKVNFLSPAVGERFRAVGRVVRSGKTITVCAADVLAFGVGIAPEGKPVALMQSTMMRMEGRDDLRG